MTPKFLRAEIAAERRSSEARARDSLKAALKALRMRRYDVAIASAGEAAAALGEARVLHDLPEFLEGREAGEGLVG